MCNGHLPSIQRRHHSIKSHFVAICLATLLLGGWVTHADAQWGISGSTVNFSKIRPKVRVVNETLPIVDFHEGDSLGPGVGCFLGACAGFKLWASGDVDVDFDADMFLGGSYGLAYKSNQTTAVVPLNPNKTVYSEFTLGTNLDPIGISKLNYKNELGTAYLGMRGELGASVGGKGCLAGCLSGSISVNPPSFEVELFGIQNKSIDVLGVPLGSLPVQYTDPKGILSVTADAPQFYQTFTDVPPGATATYKSEQNVVKVSVDAAAAIAAALGLPPLNGSVGPIDYNLLSVNGWAGLNLKDEFQLKPGALSTTYEFSAPVEVFDDTTLTWSPPIQSLTLADGQSRKLRAPGALTLGILPTYNLDIQGTTEMTLIAAVGYDASALEVGAFGENLGPLFHDKDSLPIATMTLGSESLNTTVMTKGKPLNLEFTPVPNVSINDQQTGYLVVADPVIHGDGSTTEEAVLVVNATDPTCIRSPANCVVDRTFPTVPISFRPGPSPEYPVELAESFQELSDIERAEERASGPSVPIERVLLQLAEELGVVIGGPPTDVPIGPGHPPLQDPIVRSEVTAASYPDVPIPGDFDGDRVLTANDVDLLTALIRRGTMAPEYDLTVDGLLDGQDRLFWLIGLANIPLGDANFDGRFDSSDLIDVLAAGQYEDGTRLNSGWGTGDFNGDFEFDTSDLIDALAGGAYEARRGANRPAQGVPETSASVLLAVGWLSLVGPWIRPRNMVARGRVVT